MPRLQQLLMFLVTVSPLRTVALAQNESSPTRDSHLEVSLVTAGPGRGWMEWFGHSGILVADLSTGEQKFYEYGVLTTSRETLRGAVTGNLFAGVREEPASAAMSAFKAQSRRVTIQRLDLSVDQKAEIVRRLTLAIQPGSNLLKYGVLTANCAIGPRNLIDAVTGGALSSAGKRASPLTVRQSAAALTMPDIADLAIDFTFNSEVDRAASMWEAANLPSTLESLASATSIKRDDGSIGPLVTDQWSFGPQAESAHRPGELSLLLLGLAVAVAIAGGLYLSAHEPASRVQVAIDVACGALIGIPGMILLLGWIFTQHVFLWANANLLIANPLLIAAIPLGIAARRKPRAAFWLMHLWLVVTVIAATGLALSLMHVTAQDNLRFFCLLFPLIAARASVEWRRLSSRVEGVSEQNAMTPFAANPGVTNAAAEVGSHAIA